MKTLWSAAALAWAIAGSAAVVGCTSEPLVATGGVQAEEPAALPGLDDPAAAPASPPEAVEPTASTSSPSGSSPFLDPSPASPAREPSFTQTIEVEPRHARTIPEIAAVRVRASASSEGPQHVLAVLFETPSGAAYQWIPKDVRAQQDGVAEAEFELPVAGTYIDSNNLEGVWTARLLFDGREVSSRTFELTP